MLTEGRSSSSPETLASKALAKTNAVASKAALNTATDVVTVIVHKLFCGTDAASSKRAAPEMPAHHRLHLHCSMLYLFTH